MKTSNLKFSYEIYYLYNGKVDFRVNNDFRGRKCISDYLDVYELDSILEVTIEDCMHYFIDFYSYVNTKKIVRGENGQDIACFTLT